MESSFHKYSRMDSASVVDVYDSAAHIGKDFEYIIEQYGVEAVTDLMPKVIRVLEQLEYYATQHENENEEITGLEATIRRLNCEKVARNKERGCYELELEQTEEYWRKETEELKCHVARIEEQNRKLTNRVSDSSHRHLDRIDNREEDVALIQTLQEKLAIQQARIKALQKESRHTITENDNLLAKMHLLENEIECIRRTSVHVQNQSQQLLSDQLMLKAALEDKNNQIKQLIGMQEKEHLKSIDEADQQASGPAEDPDNKPRFTLQELKDVLIERNTLKSKLIEMEEELSFYKSKQTPAKKINWSWESENTTDLAADGSDGDDNYIGPVQGPINREPWEKMHGADKSDFGIRKLLGFFGVIGKPKRALLI